MTPSDFYPNPPLEPTKEIPRLNGISLNGHQSAVAKKTKNALRFAVGSPTEYRSAIWRMWAERDDVYLAARVMGGWIKLSMHRSGIWRLAWTAQSGIRAQGSSDRVGERWQRPPEFRAGWIQGPAVIVPNTGIERPFTHVTDAERIPIVWSPTPKPGHKLHFTLLFASADASPESWQTVFRAGDKVVGTLTLRNRSMVALSRREVPMVEKESSYIIGFVADMKINYAQDVPEACEASVFTAGTDDAGHPYILDMPLGWENVRGRAQEQSGP